MTIRECYELFGGDYSGTLARLGKEDFVKRLAKKFLDDANLSSLKAAAANGDAETAFRAVHTLKGLALNLGFTNLASLSSELTEILRGGSLTGSEELIRKIEDESKKIIEAIGRLD